jgi:Transposase DDE domain group 1
MRVVVRKERPHPGVQLRFSDIDGHRFTRLRHQRHGRPPRWPGTTPGAGQGAGTRPAAPRDTGLRNLPLHGYDQNQIWCQTAALACALLARTTMLALTGKARRREPRRLRLRKFSCAGRIVRGSRRLSLRLAQCWPWTRPCR